jgi:two-component system sensor histidine kinase RpfC
VTIRALVAACPVDQACSAFTAASQRLTDGRTALIYIANGALSVVDKARVNSISGACALERATPRLVANAIHAVTAGVDSSSHDGADLSVVLRRERVHLRILVAEDNATNQKIIRQLLESAGHEVLLASDGEEALDIYQAEAPDLAILDFNMPQRTGIEVVKAIRMMEPPGVKMPTMILSASVTPEARDRAANAGADEFVGKPFDAAALVHQIDRLTKRVARGKDRAKLNRPTDHWLASPQFRGSQDKLEQGKGKVHAPSFDNDLLDGSRLSQLEDIARDPSFLKELVGGFIGDVRAILGNSGRALDSGQFVEIPDLMHSLKGAAVGVGASKLATLATALERAAVAQTPIDLAAMLNEIHECYEATSASLENYLKHKSHA